MQLHVLHNLQGRIPPQANGLEKFDLQHVHCITPSQITYCTITLLLVVCNKSATIIIMIITFYSD